MFHFQVRFSKLFQSEITYLSSILERKKNKLKHRFIVSYLVNIESVLMLKCTASHRNKRIIKILQLLKNLFICMYNLICPNSSYIIFSSILSQCHQQFSVLYSSVLKCNIYVKTHIFIWKNYLLSPRCKT